MENQKIKYTNKKYTIELTQSEIKHLSLICSDGLKKEHKNTDHTNFNLFSSISSKLSNAYFSDLYNGIGKVLNKYVKRTTK